MKYGVKELKEQDIISFKEGDIVVTHRIVKIEKEDNKTYFITKGDNNNELDKNKVEGKNIEGICVKIIPKLGDLIMFMQSKLGIFIILFVPLIIIFAYYIVASKISNKKKNNKILELQKKIEKIDINKDEEK